MNEKDLLQKIKDDAENITPPASLSPEAIEQMLRSTQKHTASTGAQNEIKAAEKIASINNRKNKKSRRVLRYGSLAAAVAVAFTALWQYQHTPLHIPLKSDITYSAVPETEQIAQAADEVNKEEIATADSADKGNTTATDSSAGENMAATGSSGNENLAMANFSEKENAAATDSSGNENLATANSADSVDTTSENSNGKETEATANSSEKENAAATNSSGNENAAATDSSEKENAAAAAARETQAAPAIEQFTYAQSYEAVYQALLDYRDREYQSRSALYGTGLMNEAEIVQEDSTMEYGLADSVSKNADISTDTGSADFSETNLQEQGVDEGDIVKTDGTYIYVLRQDLSLAILKADGKDSQVVSVTGLTAASDASIQEMYLDGNTINIILNEYITSLEEEDAVYYTDGHWQTRILTYDVSNRSQPALTGDVAQDGFYSESRKNGAYLYLFTRFTPDIQDTYEDSTIVPRLGGSAVSAEAFYVPENLRSSDYLVISSIDISSPGEILDSKVLVSGASTFYVSTENIYIANETYDSSQTRTEIIKFHYAEGQITGVAAGSVKGYLNNSFSMNEYEGNLRVVSTYYGDDYNNVRDIVSDLTGVYFDQNWTEHNSLYVLDENLQQIGAIEGLAEEETIRSARFFGDIGYFVTFRQTDPLFSVDLSDPENPRILGELKISGFSSYLHFYGDNRLLGIGYEADEETGIVSGLKLSMFDISDPANVTEVSRFILPGITWCPAIEDYKAILVEPEKNLIGFYCDNRYMVFSYDEENGFTRELLYDFYSDMLSNEAEYNTMRGLYISDDFYLAGNTFLISFDMENGFEKEGLLTIES